VRLPLARGVKITLIEQEAPAFRLEPQVLVSEKSLGSAPVTAMLEILRATAPVFVTVRVLVALASPTSTLPKLRLAGANFTTVPVPVRETVWGLPGALSVIESEAVSVPWAVGLNVTLMVHVAPAATLEPQVLVSEKSDALLPLRLTLVMVSVAAPVLVRVTVCEALDVPANCVLKVRLVGESVTAGPPETVWVIGSAVFGL